LLGKTLVVKVILDSNFLLVPSQFRLDIFEELKNLLNQNCEPVLLSPTREELERLSRKSSPRIRQHASIALTLAERCQLVNVEQESDEEHDDVIVRIAKEWKCLVATNDRELRNRLRNINIPVIYLRRKSQLEIEGISS
jgi:rRNA-processing protein FCF1